MSSLISCLVTWNSRLAGDEIYVTRINERMCIRKIMDYGLWIIVLFCIINFLDWV